MSAAGIACGGAGSTFRESAVRVCAGSAGTPGSRGATTLAASAAVAAVPKAHVSEFSSEL